MTEKEITHNTLQAYIHLKAALENLKILSSVNIPNKEFKEIIKQVKPKIAYFVTSLDTTLIQSKTFTKTHEKELENTFLELMEVTDKHLNNIL